MKKLELTEKQMQRRVRKQTRLRMQKYRDAHKGECKPFKAEISTALYELIDAKLRQDKITKKQFIEDAINKYLNKE